MVKYTQTICRQLRTNSLSVFDYFMGLAFKRLGLVSIILTHLNKALSLSWRSSLSYRNRSIAFLWFLYDRNLRHEQVKKDFKLRMKKHSEVNFE